MDQNLIIGILLTVFALKWGWELVTGKKLRKNIIGEPVATRADDPKKYWAALLLEIGLVIAITAFVFIQNN